jgi:hypothetical protein
VPQPPSHRRPSPRWLLLVPALLVACTGGAPASQPTGCQDVRALNAAVRGAGLSPEQITCLEGRAADAADPQQRIASALLVWDARRIDDELVTWRARADRHLQLEPLDVDVLIQVARTEQRLGPSGAETSLALAERGLAVAVHPERRLDLLKLRAIGAEMLAPPESPPENKARTADFAREWYAAASAAGKPTAHPLAMCTNAGGTTEWCSGQE